MKKTCSKILHSKFSILNFRRRQAGFTLIELLVVFSIIALLFTIGIAAYQEFNRGQIVVQATKELKENLRLAQSKALGAEKPGTCTGTLQGWQVSFSGDGKSYSLKAICPNEVPFRTISFLGDLKKTDGPGDVLFKVLGQGVESAGTITITGFGTKTATVTVTPSGEIK